MLLVLRARAFIPIFQHSVLIYSRIVSHLLGKPFIATIFDHHSISILPATYLTALATRRHRRCPAWCSSLVTRTAWGACSATWSHRSPHPKRRTLPRPCAYESGTCAWTATTWFWTAWRIPRSWTWPDWACASIRCAVFGRRAMWTCGRTGDRPGRLKRYRGYVAGTWLSWRRRRGLVCSLSSAWSLSVSGLCRIKV